MAFNLRNRSLLTVQDYTQREFRYLLDLARDLKRAKYARTEQKHLDGKEVCLIFEKTSTRTRCAFEVACSDQGANVTYLDPAGSQIGHKESFKDTARVLGRMFDAIEYRGASQAGIEQLAKYAGVPVYNGLTDEYHPTQMLADVMTMREHSDKPIHEIKYAYLGDTRSNMGHSLMIAGCLNGMDVRPCHLRGLASQSFRKPCQNPRRSRDRATLDADRAQYALRLLGIEMQFAHPRGVPEGGAMARVDRRVGMFAAAVVVSALIGCKEAAAPPASPEVVVAPVEARDFPVVTEWLGTTEGTVDAEIRAQVAGYLIAREYNEGQVVKKDQLLFRIDPAPFQAALAQANGDLGSARANLERERLNVARYKPLVAEGAVSQQEYDNAFQGERAGSAAVQSAQAAVETAKINLAFTEIRSPVDGIAGIANAQLGDLVGPSSQPLTVVSQLDPILVSFPVSEQEYLRFAPQIEKAMKAGEFKGGTVKLVLADGSEFPHLGIAYPAGAGVDPRTGTITLKARFPNPGNLLRAGQFARVHAQTAVLKGALVVPQRAIMDLQGQKQIAVVGPEDKVEIRTVKLGPTSGSEQVVESGLAAGDRIVVEGFQKIRAGMTVVAKASTEDVAAPPPGKNAEN